MDNTNLPAIEGGTPVRKDFLVFGQPQVLDEDIQAVTDTMKTCWLGTGKKTKELETKFAEYQGAKYAVGLNSCTAALHMAFLALGLLPGEEVICPVFTFTATVSQIIRCGLVPKFVDCQMKTQCIEPKDIEQAITPKTRAIVIVHFAGHPCEEMEKITDICKRYNLFLIEDCAHAIESLYDGKHCGTFGDIGCFSFYSTKNMSTANGEGGMLTCNDEKIENFVRKASLHGMSLGAHNRFGADGFKHYDVEYPGYKYNLTDVQSSMAITQLARIEENWIKRQKVWNKYQDAFANIFHLTFCPPNPSKNMKHAYHLFALHLKVEKLKVSRDFILNALTKEGIGTGVHYLSLHRHSYYINTFGLEAKDFPNAEWISQRTISLPISAKLTEQDTDDVINAVTKVLTYYEK
jgi:dTDP-4-amino-4,6-dideoxygalactose transaminase